MSSLPSATELLRAWDKSRPRSQQVEIGVSQLGACRRQTGYMLGGYPPDEGHEDDKTQAALGSAIHDAVAAGARLLIPEAHAEALEITFGGLKGHPDLVANGTVRDLKTLSYTMQLENRRQNGPPQRELWQVSVYAAGLIIDGHLIDQLEIDYLCRDSGDEWIWRGPFEADVVGDAMNWLEQVRTAEVAILPRDYRPESAFCQSCPFFRRCWDAEPGRDPRSVLFTDDPDAAAWGLKLEDAEARRKQAEADVADAKGALDALRTVSRPGEKEYVKVPGLEREIRFSVSKGRTSPDMPRIAVDYANAGARPPTRTGEPVISVRLVKPREDDDG